MAFNINYVVIDNMQIDQTFEKILIEKLLKQLK